MRGLFLASALLIALPAAAETATVLPAPNQDYCIRALDGFPTDDTAARYSFFKLAEDLSEGADPDVRAMIAHYGDGSLSPDTPILDIVEAIADPVVRQAAPEVTVAATGHIIDFAGRCQSYVTGQIDSLVAFEPAYGELDFNAVITEDALYLRQILSEALSRLGADTDSVHGPVATRYALSMVQTRNELEYATFASEIDQLEALYMTDLDGRLARSNDMINSEMDREIAGDTYALIEDMNTQARKDRKRKRLLTIFRILGTG